MTFKLFCGDVMPGCVARFESDDRSDLLQQVGTHAAAHHGLTAMDAEVVRAVDSQIVTVPA